MNEYKIVNITKNEELLNMEKEKLDNYFWDFIMCGCAGLAFTIMINVMIYKYNINLDNITTQELYNILIDKCLIGFIGLDIFSCYGVYEASKRIYLSNKRIRRLENIMYKSKS